jgi:uncharacterized repeat protein (TIGR03803 family)
MGNIRKFLRTALVIFITVTGFAHAQTFSVLYNFGVKNGDPLNPGAGLVQGRDGGLYGVTPNGGAQGFGAVFKLTPQGRLAVLHSFDGTAGGSEPLGGLTLGTDGNFYGTTYGGGAFNNGTVFKVAPNGNFTILYSFTGGEDGQLPSAPPVEGISGTFYGTTIRGGANGWGTIFRVTASGTLTTLYSLSSTEISPTSPLVRANNGKFYGTTGDGGTYNCGEIFSVTAGGTFAVVYSLNCSEGGNPYGHVIQAQDGNFYGTSYGWGKFSWGTVYKLTPQGIFADLYDFVGSPDGGGPYAALVEATDGKFYGAASVGATPANNGTLYSINGEGALSVLHTFDGANGANSYGTLLQHTSGTLYGNTVAGGDGTQCIGGCGTLYKLNMGLKPFVSILIPSGKVGSTVEILGQGFHGTTNVSFAGTATRFRVENDTFLIATVPVGAKTGFVTVVTRSGTLKSSHKFIVQ